MNENNFKYSIGGDGSWSDEEENLRRLNVIYKSDWCHGFRIIPRQDINPLVEMLVEDDGNLFSTGTQFDLAWAKKIVEALQKTIKYCEEHQLYKYRR